MGFFVSAIVFEGRATLGGGGIPSGRPTPGIGTVSLEAWAEGLETGLGFEEATERLEGAALPPGNTRRWPTTSLFASLMPLIEARFAVLVPWRMAMALRLSPGCTV